MTGQVENPTEVTVVCAGEEAEGVAAVEVGNFWVRFFDPFEILSLQFAFSTAGIAREDVHENSHAQSAFANDSSGTVSRYGTPFLGHYIFNNGQCMQVEESTLKDHIRKQM